MNNTTSSEAFHRVDNSLAGSITTAAAETRHASMDTPVVTAQYIYLATVAITILSIATNLLILIYICCHKRARTALNVAMSSIAVADVFICVIVTPSALVVTRYDVISEDQLTTTLCKLSKYIFYWCKSIKIYSVMAMILDRYYNTCHPHRNINSVGRCIFFLSIIWFFGAAFNIWEVVISTAALINIEDGRAGLNITIRMCIASNHFQFVHSAFKISILTVTYAVPMVTAGYYFVRIYMDRANLDKSQSKQMAFSVTAFALFYACQLPSDILNYMIYYLMAHVSVRTLVAAQSLDIVAYAHCLLNACAFVLLSPDIHESLRRRCKQWTSKQRRDVMPLSSSRWQIEEMPIVRTTDVKTTVDTDDVKTATNTT